MQPDVNRTIAVEDPFTLEDYKKASRQYGLLSFRLQKGRTLSFLVIFVLMGVSCFFTDNPFFIAIYAIAIILLGVRLFQRFVLMPEKAYRKLEPVTPRKFFISNSGIIRSSQNSTASYKWPDIKAFRQTKDFYYIMLGSQYFALPKHCFASDADREAFEALAGKHAGKVGKA